MKKKLLLVLGFISLGLGVTGIVLPLLPTTPFLLLSTYCFSRSSEKFHRFILENKVFGQYIRDYNEKKGITLKNKIIAMSVLSVGIGYSFYKVPNIYMRGMLAVVFIGVSIHLLKLNTLKEDKKEN